ELVEKLRLFPLSPPQKEKWVALLSRFVDMTGCPVGQAALDSTKSGDFDSEFMIYNPAPPNGLLVEGITQSGSSGVHPIMRQPMRLAGEPNVGAVFKTQAGTLQAAERGFTTCRFTGKAGAGFARYLPKEMTLYLQGSSGRITGHLSEGTIIVTESSGTYTGHEAGGTIIVGGTVGDRSFERFSGHAIVRGMGNNSCTGVSPTAVIVSLTPPDSLSAQVPASATIITKADHRTGPLTEPLRSMVVSLLQRYRSETGLSPDLSVDDLGVISVSDYPKFIQEPAPNLEPEMMAARWNRDVLDAILAYSSDEPTISMGNQRDFYKIEPSLHHIMLPFAQLTRPPIDAASESKAYMNLQVVLRGRIYASQIMELPSPIMTPSQWDTIVSKLSPPVITTAIPKSSAITPTVEWIETQIEPVIGRIIAQLRRQTTSGIRTFILDNT
ncbi:hypothetical protein EBR96_09850, partial [bacterium]|nr:hypothetical protein [bacterium]